jgi:drug/metabolite transporter (DMT)-like permease
MSTHLPAIVDLPRDAVNDALRWFAALVCASSAGVHAGLTPEHLRESVPLGLAFAVSVVVLAAGALRLRREPSGARWVALALVAVAGAYLLSRTTGLPVLVPEPEPVDTLGVLTTSAEVLAAVAVRCLPLVGKEPR